MTLANRARHLHTTLMALDRPAADTLTSPRRASRQYPALDFYLRHWSPILLSLELILDLYFLYHGPLHPIDYPTYLVQVRQVRLGERDYANIYGPTGPLVYPGGHVFIFSIFEKLFGIKGDSNWTGYLPAQSIFLALQLAHTFVSFSMMEFTTGGPSNIPTCIAITATRLRFLSFYHSRSKSIS